MEKLNPSFPKVFEGSYLPGPGESSFFFGFSYIVSTNTLFILSLETPKEKELLTFLEDM